MSFENEFKLLATQNGFLINVSFYIGLCFIWLKLVLISIFICVGTISITWFPDIDQWFLGILHHRSIITHSILIPLIISAILSSRFKPVTSLIFNAVGIHLSADLLSPPIGYGAIWLPAPFKMSLGGFSIIWIAFNALIAFYFAYKYFYEKYLRELFWGTLLAGVAYGLQNEKSLPSAAMISLFICLIAIWRSRKLNFSFVPREALSAQSEKRANALNERERIKTFSPKSKRGISGILLSLWRFLIILPKIINQHRSKSILCAVAITVLVSIFYFTGINVAVEAAKGGVWVLHSSGGWILHEGGGYVAGTLTPIKP